MRDFLEISHLAPGEVRELLDRARKVKWDRGGRVQGGPDRCQYLAGRTVALLFEKPSTRTRLSFDLGVRQMGGQSMILSGSELHLGQGGESVADTARVMDRLVDLAMIRTYKPEVLNEFSYAADIPVINGLTDRSHPCQIMADVQTFEERHGEIEGCRIAWLGTGTNVCNSLLEAAGALNFQVVFCGPEDRRPSSRSIKFAESRGCQIIYEPDPKRAVRNVQAVMTDAWTSMHESPASAKERRALLGQYQVNRELMDLTDPGTLFMHCLPAHRGEEVTDEVMDGARSVVFDQVENRLHVQKAIMLWCLGL